MFEKEAEETVKRCVCGDCNKCQSYGYIGCDIYRYSKDSCLYGLREGYNKANESISVLDFITAMMCMNNDCNCDNPTLGGKIAESLNWFSKHNDVLKEYFERQMNIKNNLERNCTSKGD